MVRELVAVRAELVEAVARQPVFPGEIGPAEQEILLGAGVAMRQPRENEYRKHSAKSSVN